MDPQLDQEVPNLDRDFPRLRPSNALKTSPRDRRYNCIAWAVGESRRWWWPVGGKLSFWPHGVPGVATVDAFTAAFKTKGYDPCADGAREAGFEKIALFADAGGVPTHAARLLADRDRWTSKLGQCPDIEHDLGDVAGGAYGHVVRFYRKPIPPPPTAPAISPAPTP